MLNQLGNRNKIQSINASRLHNKILRHARKGESVKTSKKKITTITKICIQKFLTKLEGPTIHTTHTVKLFNSRKRQDQKGMVKNS